MKKIDFSKLSDDEINTLIKFNKTIENFKLLYEKYIKPLETKNKGEK